MQYDNFRKQEDPEWIIVLVEAFLDINMDKLTKDQKKLLRELYFEKLNSGLKPKEAIKQALDIVLCFDSN